MKKHFVLSALTLALLSACGGSNGGNSDGAVLPPANINGSQTARSTIRLRSRRVTPPSSPVAIRSRQAIPSKIRSNPAITTKTTSPTTAH